MRAVNGSEDSSGPVIGVLASMLVMESGLFPGMERSFVNHDYISAVEAAGGVPLMLPVVRSAERVRRQVESVDALILTGGYDPNPMVYGEDPERVTEFIFPEIDEHQLNAIRAADELGKPMLGICRGMQILNIAFGGTLYQDLSLAPNCHIQHFQKSRRHSPGHRVKIEENTVLGEVFGASMIETNSFHHLALKDIAPGFIVNARAADGVAEGIERREGTPVTAVQWHPEMMFEKHPAMLGIFTKFMEMADGRNALEPRQRRS